MAPVTLKAPELPESKFNDWVLAVVPLTAPPTVSAPPAVLSQESSVRVKAVLASPKLITPEPLELM